MKLLRSGILRAICSLIVGVLLLKYPSDALIWLTMVIGILFLLPGVVSIATYLVERKNARPETVTDSEGRVIAGGTPTFPIVAVGSIILGLFLALMPSTFVHFLLYVLAIILILGAVSQIMNIIRMKKMGEVSNGMFVVPCLILLAGMVLILKPGFVAKAPMVIIGIFCLIYGINELINSILGYRLKRQWEKSGYAEAEEIVDETEKAIENMERKAEEEAAEVIEEVEETVEESPENASE